MKKSHREWYRLARHTLSMPGANGYAMQLASRCLRNCLPRNTLPVYVTLASREAFLAGRRIERDHILPLKMATREMHAGMSESDWCGLIERYSQVALVTHEENMRLSKVPPGADWQARYEAAGVA